MNKILRRLLNKVNKVTAFHRHGQKIPPKNLNDLSNYQLEAEKALENACPHCKGIGRAHDMWCPSAE